MFPSTGRPNHKWDWLPSISAGGFNSSVGFVVGQGSGVFVGMAVSAGSCAAIGVGLGLDVAVAVSVDWWGVGVCMSVGEGIAVAVSVGTAVSVAGSNMPATVTVAKGDGRGVCELLTGVMRATPSAVVSVVTYFPDQKNKPATTGIPKASIKNFILALCGNLFLSIFCHLRHIKKETGMPGFLSPLKTHYYRNKATNG